MPESLLQPAWIDAQGRREGRYVVGPLLGHGAMGDVYEAWDIVLARPVALKILQHLEPAAMIRFMHEAQLHARLDSPNICRIYDVDASGGTPRIAMQLIRGPTLEDAAQDLRLDEVVAILAQVAEAVHGAHQLNLIHRDIKPSNILLQWNEHRGWTPYICDFGLAMSLDGPSVTQPLALTGTPAYMAPEQVRGDRSLVGPPTDVYGIGSTLYFTLVGRPPCVSTATAEMLKVKRERRFPSPRSLEPDIPPALEAILFKCLEPLPQDRYATAAELAEELQGLWSTLTGQPASGAGPGARAMGWVRAHSPFLAVLTVTICLFGSFPALAGFLKRRRTRDGEMTQTIALEGSSLEQSIRNERLLPVHDLRPADALTRARMAALQSRAAGLGPGAEGPVNFALGRAHFLLQDLPQAQAELEKAWSAGFQTPDAAFLLAQIQASTYQALTRQADFLGLPPPPAAAQALAQAGHFLLEARMQTGHPREYVEALDAQLRDDQPRALELAKAALKANPWHLDSAVLASGTLSLEARQHLDAGDSDGAEARYREALDLARGALAKGQSDPRLHHASATAALGLAAVALENGDLTQRRLEDLEQQTSQALRLDPGNQDAQSDWLQVRALKAMRLWGLGQDPRPVLDQALQFYWAQTREPRGLELRMDHLILYWLQAERDFQRGEDPAPSLTEALKDPGHTATRFRDFQGDLLNFQARFEAARGRDPRPMVETVVARFTPLAQQQGGCNASEIAAKALLIRAEWETRHRIDASASIQQAQALLTRALEGRPTSAAAHALHGLSQVLEAKNQPGNRKWLIGRAQEHLRWSMRLNPADLDVARLRAALEK
ncbi:MAG: serine/threonine-protein kinase [Holophaga sp.]|nr:serine/threonine-protein kinase [Holophaga sp.]